MDNKIKRMVGMEPKNQPKVQVSFMIFLHNRQLRTKQSGRRKAPMLSKVVTNCTPRTIGERENSNLKL